MNKNFKFYTVIWAALFALYNVIVFLVRPILPLVSTAYNTGFWIAWGISIAAFICNMVCAYITLHGDNLERTFYRIPLIHMSYTCLISMLMISGALMLIPSCPAWISAVVCVAVFLLQVISLVKSEWAVETVEATEQKIQERTSFIREITADAEKLISSAQTDEAGASCRKVYEALRYSDPMSSEELAEIETEIKQNFEIFSEKIAAGEEVSTAADELMELIGDRSRKCKLTK